MHYTFQCVLKISKCFFKMFSTHFKHKNSPIVWTMLKTGVKTMSSISKCVENYVENFKVCWKPYQKFQSVPKITVMWPLRDPIHQFWNIIAVIIIKSDIINEDYRSLWCYMWSMIWNPVWSWRENWACLLELLHNVHATENF